MKSKCFQLLAILFSVTLFSGSDSHADQVYIAVGKAKAKKAVLAFPKIKANSKIAKYQRQIQQTVTADLRFMDLFRFMSSAGFVEKKGGIVPGSFLMSDWTKIGVEFLIKSSLKLENRKLTLEAHLYDTFGGKEILAKRYIGAQAEIRTMAHTFANEIVTSLTGLPGIFLTKIAMSCDRTKRKEIYMMDFDGTHVKRVTHHRSIAFSPAWSPDGTKLVYSVYTKRRSNNVKNIDLFQFDFRKNRIKVLSNRKGINSGASFSPDGQSLALTMSFLGNPEIFSLNPNNKKVTRLTKTWGFDVSPDYSPDGKYLVFSSSRSGKPMLYKMSTDGTKTQRLTYAGRYNASPSWSPRNNKIAFAGWIDKHFDIFIMNPDGTNIERLTRNQGSNEDPHFSPDGNFVVFSSNRTGKRNIYVMNVDGTFVKRLTYGLGNCSSPKWSSPPPSLPSKPVKKQVPQKSVTKKKA